MRRLSVPAALVLAAAAPGAAHAQSGGVQYAPQPLLAARAFTLSPPTVTPGATLTIRYRIDGRARRMRVRIDLLPEGGGPAAARLRLGLQPTGRRLTATWAPRLAPGRYAARLRATAPRRRARASSRAAVEVVAPIAGVFPVAGPFTLGCAEARFGAKRPGHWHRGQDIMAAEGTPVVAPRAGSIAWRAYQRDGAGHYIVLRGDDSRDYVFMHFQDGSVVVEKGQAVAIGERLGAVGSTGRADGPHLHFEIWPGGWYAEGSEPIDPLPDLLSWAG